MRPIRSESGPRMRRRRLLPARRRQAGLATLVVVMILFFIIAMVAAYTSRNMIFEQRASANLYRSTQAFEAAEAGVQWALSMLNSGRIDDNCQPTNDLTKSTFRARYIDSIDTTGAITLRTRADGTPLMPACAFDAATNSWSCLCPSDAAAAVPAIVGTDPQPMFRIQFQNLGAGGRADSIQIVSAGCTRPDPVCLAANPSAPAGDAMALVTAMVTLRSGLSTPPGAAVTALLNIDGSAGGGPLQAVNVDTASVGITFLAGGNILNNVLPVTLPGTPGSLSLAPADPTLAHIVPAGPVANTADRMFSLVFGMAPGVYLQQPAVVTVDCTVACTSAAINALAQLNPGRMLWLNGDLTVNGDIGTAPVAGGLLATEVPASGPVVLVVTGQATLGSGTVFGALYSRSVNWDRGAGNGQVQGALIAEGNLGGNGTQVITYDPAILTRLRTRYGSFVRLNGGWKDF